MNNHDDNHPNTGTRKIKFRLEINGCDPSESIEVTEDETIGSVKCKVIEKSFKHRLYQEYEGFCEISEKQGNRVQYQFPWSEQKLNTNKIKNYSISANMTIKECIDLEADQNFMILEEPEIHYYNRKSLTKYPKVIFSGPGVSFESKGYNEQESKGLSYRNYSSINAMRYFFTQKFHSNCTISLKKKNSSEYLILTDNDPLPFRNKIIYVQFEKRITIEEAVAINGNITSINGWEVSNFKCDDKSQLPAKITVYEMIKACNDKSNPKIDKITTATGAFVGFINSLIFSSLCRNCLPSIAIRLSPNLILGGTALSVLGVSLLGMCTGGVIGAAASYIYNKYFHNNKTYEVDKRTVYTSPEIS